MQENEDVLAELRSLHEKEKSLLMEENTKLSAELERSVEVSVAFSKVPLSLSLTD